MSDLENCHEGIEAVDVQGVHLVQIGDDKVEEATSSGNIPVLFGQGGYFVRRHLCSKSKSGVTDAQFMHQGHGNCIKAE